MTLKLSQTPPRVAVVPAAATRGPHRLEVHTPAGDVVDVSGWPGDAARCRFADALAAADALRAGLAEAAWRRLFLPGWVRDTIRTVRALGADPRACAVAVGQPVARGGAGGRHGWATVCSWPVVGEVGAA